MLRGSRRGVAFSPPGRMGSDSLHKSDSEFLQLHTRDAEADETCTAWFIKLIRIFHRAQPGTVIQV